MRKSKMPVNPEVCEVTGHRKPTNYEVRFGYGATHYKTFKVDLWLKPGGFLKCWIVCPVDGLRYYR